MSIVKWSLPVLGLPSLVWLAAGLAHAYAEPISHPDSLSNEALGATMPRG
jgi:hypothetical protein